MSLSNRVAAAVAAALVMAAPSVAAERETSKSWSFATYIEREGRFSIIVGSFPAALNDDQLYIPLQVAIGVKGKGPEVTVTPESLLLIDQVGDAYPVASYSEIMDDTKLLEYNRAIEDTYPLVVGQEFVNSFRQASNFFPQRGQIQIPRVNLARETYLADLFYFPRPDSGLGGVMTLRFKAPELAEPIDVRFEIPLKGKRRAKKRAG